MKATNNFTAAELEIHYQQFNLQDFIHSGLTEKEYRWFYQALPVLGAEAALRAVFDGHTDYLLVEYGRYA